MCGIGGIIGMSGPAVEHTAMALRDRMTHRGPDDCGRWVSDVGLATFVHRRLSIMDPNPRSAQPMVSSDGRVAITFNGEIYNHRTIRADLERVGVRFRTTSDTEVLVEAWAHWGEFALPRLRGMFAFAVHERDTGVTFLVRDARGIKPLYFTERLRSGTLRGARAFASEVSALRPLVDEDVDRSALVDLLIWGNIAAPRTFLRDVRALPAGHLARVALGTMTIRRWSQRVAWDVSEFAADGAERLREAVRDSVRAHLVADVPIAVFLSSGVDSAVVASVAAHADSSIHALTVRDATGAGSDESAVAAAIARRLGIPHTVVDVSGPESAAAAAESAHRLDQPSVDGVNSFIISRAAHEAGFKVALSGVGGDELFGGYRDPKHFRRLARLGRLVGPASAVVRGFRHEGSTDWSRRTSVGRANWLLAHGAAPYGPYLLTRAIFAPAEAARMADVALEDVLRIVADRIEDSAIDVSHPNYGSAIEIAQYLAPQLLRDTDAASMTSSLEVRTPLVDERLFAAAAACDPRSRLAGPAKRLLRSAAQAPLDDLVLGPKRGFSVPMGAWIQTGSLQVRDDAASVLDPDSVRACLSSARQGREHWSRAWVLHALGAQLSMAGTDIGRLDQAMRLPATGVRDAE